MRGSASPDRTAITLLLLAAAWALAGPATASEAEIVLRLGEFFASDDPGERAQLAAAIDHDEAFARGRLSGWLHQANLFPPEAPGTFTMIVDVGLGERRAVTVQVPRGYDPGRPWPVLYLLHPSGGNGPGFLYYAAKNLGPRVDDFIVVAPSGYHQTGLDAPAPFTADHSAILRAVRTRFNVDADRQYAMGFSLGGYASWNLALLHAEETAGAVPVGSCFTVPPGEDGLWRDVLPNFAQVPVLNVWGSLDSLEVLDVFGEPEGTVPEMNHRFIDWTAGLDLPVRHLEVPGAGHTDIAVPWEDLEPILTHRRPHYPGHVDHTFRHLHQGRAYWLEAHAWEGASWGEDLRITPAAGESRNEAYGRVARGLLGNLRGDIQGQGIRIATRHVRELTVWIGDEIGNEVRDWRLPVTLWRDGKRIFRGKLQPDLLLALTQAARTHDFENLRWSGLRVTATRKAAVVSAKTAFPPLDP